jgi:hypothetical protein
MSSKTDRFGVDGIEVNSEPFEFVTLLHLFFSPQAAFNGYSVIKPSLHSLSEVKGCDGVIFVLQRMNYFGGNTEVHSLPLPTSL